MSGITNIIDAIEAKVLGRFRLRTKMLAGFFLALFPIMAVLSYSSYMAYEARDIFQSNKSIDALADDINEIVRWSLNYATTQEPQSLDKVMTSAERYKDSMAALKHTSAYNEVENAFNDYYKIFIELDGAFKTSARVNVDDFMERLQAKGDILRDVVLGIKNESFSSTENFLKKVALVVFLCTVFTIVNLIVSAMFFGWRMSIPLNILTERGEELADGNIKESIYIETKDEFGRLSLAFDRFTNRIKDMMKKLNVTCRHLLSASNDLASTSQMAAQDAERIYSSTSQIAVSMEEMNHTVSEVAKNAHSAYEQSLKSREVARSGEKIVEDAIQGMGRIKEKVEESSKTIKRLGEKSQEIGNIVAVINNIADQTNLLALNAAIEAARAGEQGRGFAVVADEVRKLAERTTKATKEIDEMINGIRAEVETTVASMENGRIEVETGMPLVYGAGSALKEIVVSIENVSDMNQQIATAAEEQSAAVREISGNIENITSVTKRSAEVINNSSGAAKELLKLAEGLEEVVNQFRVSQEDKHGVDKQYLTSRGITEGEGRRFLAPLYQRRCDA